jgi:hypothetical protein
LKGIEDRYFIPHADVITLRRNSDTAFFCRGTMVSGLPTVPASAEGRDDQTTSTINATWELGDDVEKGFELPSSTSQEMSLEEEMPKENVAAETPDPNIVDWDGPDDPKNPMNWSSFRKWTTIGLVSTITFVTYVFCNPSTVFVSWN